MNAQTIKTVLEQNYAHLFHGIYASNENPPKKTAEGVDGGIIFNTAPNTTTGEHWIAIYTNSKVVDFFCSFGSLPRMMAKNIQEYIIRQQIPSSSSRGREKKTLRYNQFCLQTPCAATCGLYTCLFIACRAEKMSFDIFLAQFSLIDTHKNDRLVMKAFRSIFHQEPYTKRDVTWLKRNYNKNCI